jgi:hypothetical protein
MKKLEAIQRKGLSICLGLSATPRREAMEVEGNILPVDLRIEEIAVRMFAKPFISLVIWMELLAFLSTCMMWLSNLIFSSKIIPSSLGVGLYLKLQSELQATMLNLTLRSDCS